MLWFSSSSPDSFVRRAACSLSFLALLGSSGVSAQLNNETSPTHQFKSRPDLHAPIIDFAILRPELVTPGYIFFAPYRNLDPGPYIYDNYGNLVWSGAGSSGPKTAHTPRVCQYKGEDHLCYFQGEQHQGFARGHGVIMDKNYRIVKTIESSGAGASSDMHEFKMTPYSDGTTALMTVYQPRQYDLTTNPRFNIQNGMGWIVEGVFQEVDIETGNVLFEWRSLDHVDPGMSWTLPSSTDTSGDGLHEQSPWDYFHINSVDKNEDGDYLISARHVSAIYKLSGVDGSIMWEMGGNNPTFEQTNFNFSYQHHARWVYENTTHTILSFYDNGSNTFNSTGKFSHGWIISLDHIANTATKIAQWGAPEKAGGLLSGSQGNMQLLPDGNCHIGWGEHAYFSEHTSDGTPVMYAKVAERASNVMIYRSNKYNWTAQPLTKPALWTYSRIGNRRSGMRFYVSWNGATEVYSWNFYASNSSSGTFELIGNATKTGFETEYAFPAVALWTYAEAVDVYGRALERSVTQRTFIPSPGLVNYCDNRGCDTAQKTPDANRTEYNVTVQVDQRFLSPNRGFDTTHYYQDLPNRIAHKTLQVGSIIAIAVAALVVLGVVAIMGLRSLGTDKPGQDEKSVLPVWLTERAYELRQGLGRTELGSRVLGRYSRLEEKDEPESDENWRHG